jgi:hypothetical protein
VESFPRMIDIEQQFPKSGKLEIDSRLADEFRRTGVLDGLPPGSRIAVGVGSRGITNLQQVVAAVLARLRSAGAKPFIVPAMGSHGGATPEGQTEVLAGYGITSAAMGVPIRPSMEAVQIGNTPDGTPVFFSAEAANADAVIVINRVKPHTDFVGSLGSGILKMLVIGFGKRMGASACHNAASRLGHEHVIRSAARVVLSKVPLLCGVAILEDHAHKTAHLEVLLPAQIEAREPALLRRARSLMPRLPFSEIDVLIVDQIGKNISGAGMDPNITGRSVTGGTLALPEGMMPVVHRIFVRGLTEASHGNAIGIGLADFTRSDVLRQIDWHSTYINALTALTPATVKVPIHYASDREVLSAAIQSAAVPPNQSPRIVRILDTLNLARVQVSEAYLDDLRSRRDLRVLNGPAELEFDTAGNLPPMKFFAPVPA